MVRKNGAFFVEKHFWDFLKPTRSFPKISQNSHNIWILVGSFTKNWPLTRFLTVSFAVIIFAKKVLFLLRPPIMAIYVVTFLLAPTTPLEEKQ